MDKSTVRVPLHRADLGEEEIAAVVEVLRSGWLTSGSECRRFEQEFAAYLGVPYALALNSCTAALHLALDATGLRAGELVLVPAFTFTATAEVVTYFGATPVLVDCEPDTLNLDMHAATLTAARIFADRPVPGVGRAHGRLHAIIPVHYAGQMADVDGAAALAQRYGLRVIEDSAHALPAAARGPEGNWRSIGTTAEMTCFSFYANKTITTGEGGMLVAHDPALIDLARRKSLHGMSNSAWDRQGRRTQDYEVVSSGFKYNLTDIAAALGRKQLERADRLCAARTRVAERYHALLGDLDELQLPTVRSDRRSAWHIYAIRLRLDQLTIDRDSFLAELKQAGVGASVHWKPLHLQPFYRESFGYRPEHFPVATAEWQRLVSLPIFPSMTDEEIEYVAIAVRSLVQRARRRVVA
jgi:dTDP-4-amino-4,6-dideoxygalactose transaminase